ncbi:type I-F CRISPR-associated protein Csy3 [Litoribrevibacter albus]|uniref:CRISPR-associated protein Csy3 n=1 Tax=Litoribrevibacter albus TaxID=1473156 RepID=A0AA37W9B5_9GAMM|nr:CRISPR-associated protein Csy3 [Litoribrevibacter albus]
MSNLKTASVLAFERKLSNSDALMFSGNWNDIDNEANWQGISIQEKSVRGTISNRQKNAIMTDPAKLDQEVQKPNLQKVDSAALPFEHDTLKVEFTLRVLGSVQQPSTCNSQDYRLALETTVNNYIEQQGFSELAKRYATNLASGRFLWRNRVGAESIQVHINEAESGNTWKFNGYDFKLSTFDQSSPDLDSVSSVIEKGLSGKDFSLVTVKAFVKLGQGQEVFPSQELVLDSGTAKDKKSKTLYQVNETAAMHSQKIGNAIRTIDTWFPEAESVGAISVEPFGSVTSQGKAYRQPKQKMDFYTLLDNWVLKGQEPALDQQHYVIANLIRGGVYGEKSE